MTKQRLEEYRSNKAELAELQYKLEHLGDGDSLIGSDVILDYRKGYPQPQAIVGYDYELERRRRERWERRIAQLKEELEEVEAWIEAIPESVTRRIFRMYYINGDSQEKIGKKLYLTQQAISYRLKKFLDT